MSVKLSISRQLVKGDKRVVTIEDAINDCIVVSMIYQNRKFCGALMDITKRNGPYGVSETFAKPIGNATSESICQHPVKTPFPQPLLTRQSYNLNVSQPPLPLFKKLIRRAVNSKLENSVGIASFDEYHTKQCSLDRHVSEENNCQLQNTLNGPLPGDKRKSGNNCDSILSKKYSKLDFLTTSQNNSPISNASKALASPLKHLIPQETRLCTSAFEGYSQVISEDEKFFKEHGVFQGFSSNVSAPSTDILVTIHDSNKRNFKTKHKVAKKSISNRRSLRTNTQKRNFASTKNNKESCSYECRTEESSMVKLLSQNNDQRKKKQFQKSASHKKKRLRKESVETSNFKSPNQTAAEITIEEANTSVGPSVGDSKAILAKTDSRKSTPAQSKKTLKSASADEAPACNVNSHVIYVTSCKTLAGTLFTQGDVVWGKLAGYPWWPSRVVKLIVTKTQGKSLQQEAMVAWFRNKTTSIISLDRIQLFNEHFATRFEKRRRGVYQKAVKDAQAAAQKITPEVRKLISQFET